MVFGEIFGLMQSLTSMALTLKRLTIFDMAKTVGFEDADEANVKNCFSATQRSSTIDTSIGIRDDDDANRE
jgi:hypothetical protein